MKTIKARTMSELAKLFQVSETDLEEQIECFPALRNDLKRQGYLGKYFYPRHQKIIFRHLGEPEEDDKSVKSTKA